MKDFFTYKILPELKLVIELGYGTLNFDKGLSFKLEEVKDKDFDPTFNFLVVYTHVNVQISKKDINHYVEALKKHKEIIGKRRSAMLTSTPNHVVFNYLYREALREFPMTFEIFSSLGPALIWLGVPIENENKIKGLIDRFLETSTLQEQ